jgi:hypothetical protein
VGCEVDIVNIESTSARHCPAKIASNAANPFNDMGEVAFGCERPVERAWSNQGAWIRYKRLKSCPIAVLPVLDPQTPMQVCHSAPKPPIVEMRIIMRAQNNHAEIADRSSRSLYQYIQLMHTMYIGRAW